MLQAKTGDNVLHDGETAYKTCGKLILEKLDSTAEPKGKIVYETVRHCGKLIRDKLNIQGNYFPTKLRGHPGLFITTEGYGTQQCHIKPNDFIKEGEKDEVVFCLGSTPEYLANAQYWGAFRQWKDEVDACWLPKRLVDVDNGCIVHTSPRSRYPAYVAFSRRWSKASTSAGLAWESNVGIAFSMKSLIDVTRAMGFKWMWVDTLCIDQNSTIDREEQIPYMGLVYSNAAVTVALLEDTVLNEESCIAMDKTNIYGTKFDEYIRLYDDWIYDKDLILSLNNTIKKLSNAEWFKRVWTLQELFKSSILMYITLNGVVLANDTLKVINRFDDKLMMLINSYIPGISEIDHFNFLWQWESMLVPAQASCVLSWTDSRYATFEHDKLFGILGMMNNVDYRPSYENDFCTCLNNFLLAALKKGDVSVLFGIGCGIMDECYTKKDVEFFPSQFYKLRRLNCSNTVVSVNENSVTVENVYCETCNVLTIISCASIHSILNDDTNIKAEYFLSSLSGNCSTVILETAIDVYSGRPLRNSVSPLEMSEAMQVRDYIRLTKYICSELALDIVFARTNNDRFVSSFVRNTNYILANTAIAYFDPVDNNGVSGLLLGYNEAINGFSKIGVILNMPFRKTSYKNITIFK